MRIPAGALRLGRNTVTVRVSFMRTTNIEALYLVGEFGVKAQGQDLHPDRTAEAHRL